MENAASILIVDDDRDIRTVNDIPGVNGSSYCAEFLAPEQK